MKMTAQAQIEVNHAEENAKAWYASIIEMLQALNADTDEADQKYEDAMQVIHESVLSVMVRDGWREPGQTFAEDGAEEYEILLTTGGPALRIYGHLNSNGEPHSAEMQWQDWGTRWTRYPSPEADLLRFAQCFYFGE
jgi:hypothetical protein